MNEEQKAKELIEKYKSAMVVNIFGFKCHHEAPNSAARQCAIIAVDEILELDVPVMLGQDSTPYWEKVKEILNK